MNSPMSATRLKRLFGLILGFLLVGATLVLWGSSQALAADPKEAITLSPAVKKISADPGQLKKGKLKIINSGDTSYRFTLYARPYSVDTEAYAPNYQATPARSDLYRWVQFDQTGGELKPGQQKDIGYTILVPDKADAGGHYGVLFAQTISDQDSSQLVVRNKRVGSVIRLAVSGDIKRSGEIDSQSIAWLQTEPPLSAEMTVKNDGNIDFDATSKLVVKTLFGREVYNAEVDHVVYPDKPRQIRADWQGASLLGLYHVENTVTVLDKTKTVSSYVLMIPKWAIMLLVLATVFGADAYGSDLYGGSETKTVTDTSAAANNQSALASTGYDIIIPIALALAIIFASLVLFAKLLIRKRKNQQSQ